MDDFRYQLWARVVGALIGGLDLGLSDGDTSMLEKDLLEDKQARDAVPDRRQEGNAPQKYRYPDGQAHRGLQTWTMRLSKETCNIRSPTNYIMPCRLLVHSQESVVARC